MFIRAHLINLTIQEKVKTFHHLETANQKQKNTGKKNRKEPSNFTTNQATQDNSLMKMVKKFLSKLFNNNTICKCKCNSNKWINNTIKNKNMAKKEQVWINTEKKWKTNEKWCLTKTFFKLFCFFHFLGVLGFWGFGVLGSYFKFIKHRWT